VKFDVNVKAYSAELNVSATPSEHDVNSSGLIDYSDLMAVQYTFQISDTQVKDIVDLASVIRADVNRDGYVNTVIDGTPIKNSINGNG
jgi:hypothetical protein